MILKLLLILAFTTSLSAYELSILAMFRDEARYLKEWVDYHRMVGVEHFWLYNDHSEDNWREVLQDYIEAGIVEVTDWTEGTNRYDYTRQPAIYRDGIPKTIGKTKWLAIVDIDEFIIPMKEETVTDCLRTHYPDEPAIYVNWHCFGTSKITVPEGGSILSYLTASSLSYHPLNATGKSIFRPEGIILETIWTPHHFDLKPGYWYMNGSGLPLAQKNGTYDYGAEQQTKWLRVNHYVFRDEYFFWNYRYKRTGDKKLLMEQYEALNVSRDKRAQKLIKQIYPNQVVVPGVIPFAN